MRDRLIELIGAVQSTGVKYTHEETASSMGFRENAELADYLLANGVTVQEWISVKDRLPDKNGNYLTYDQRYGDIEIYYYMGCDEWEHHRNGITDAEGHGFTHWMPLPQPPKGE